MSAHTAKQIWTLASFWVIRTASPSSSNCGRPARPIICRIVLRSYSLLPGTSPLSRTQRRVPFRTTKCAGRLTPCASVDVVQRTCMSHKCSAQYVKEKYCRCCSVSHAKGRHVTALSFCAKLHETCVRPSSTAPQTMTRIFTVLPKCSVCEAGH